MKSEVSAGRCTASPPCTFREVPLEDIQVEWDGPALGRKAVAFPGLRLICLERRFWCSIPTVQGRAAILAHERGHIEGARCESCADVRAGEILRREGYSTPRDGFRALYSTLDHRDYSEAAEDLLRGFGLDDKVLHRERAAGVDARLQRFLDWWARYGPFPVMVGVDGGLRTDARQLELYAQGRQPTSGHPSTWPVVDPGKVVTHAWSAMAGGKHGLGLALDLWPVKDGQPVLDVRPPENRALYRRMGEIAKQHGFVWGGDWTRAFPPSPQNPDGGDLPHIELPDRPNPALLAGGALLALFVLLVVLT